MKIEAAFARMSLQTKLITNIAMLAMFMAMVLGVGWFTSVQMERGFHELLEGPVVMRDIMRQAHNNVLAARGSQRQYLLNRKAEDAKEVKSRINQAVGLLEQLQSIDEHYGHEEDAVRNQKIIKLLKEYLTAFEGVVKAWQVKGLDDNSGLRGEFGTAIRELGGLLQNFDTAEIRIQLSDVIIHHQEYMHKRDEPTLLVWRNSLELLNKAIQKSEVSHFDKDKFKEFIEQYVKTFEKLVAQPVVEEGDKNEEEWEKTALILDPMMDSVKRYYIRNISLDFSVLRRYERDYLLLGEQRTVKRFSDSVKKMLENVANAKGVPEKMRGDVSRFLEQYQQNFMKLVEQDQEITRLREVMRKAIEDIAPILEEHVGAAEQEAKDAGLAIDSKSKTLLVTMVGVGLLATLLAGFFNQVLGKGIRQQVGDEPSTLEQQAAQVASGDLTVDLMGGTGIRQAMGQMVQNLRAFARHGALQSETISAVVGQQLLAKEELISDITSLVEKMDKVLADNHTLDLEVDKLRSDLRQISDNTEQTSESTDELSREFSAISSRVVRAGDNLSRVADSSHNANLSLEEMRQAMAETGDNISTVASAVEEMTANLAGVRSRCEDASSEAIQAQSDARATAEVMERLRRTTREVGKVVEVIKSIAEQTNLLALNASIEAGAAGALGRGFAVVASEVKELATQTRKATETIRQKVAGIQESTSEASKATNRVFQSIGNLAQSNEEILNAVSDQTQALNEITQSVGMVSQQTGEVVELVNRTTMELAEVDKKIQEISTGVNEVGRNVQEGVITSRHVAQQAQDSRERAQRMLQQADVMVDAALAVKNAALEAKGRVGYLQGTTSQIGQLVEVVSVVSRELGEAQHHFKVGSSRFDIQALKSAHLGWMMDLNHFFSGRVENIASLEESSCDICRLLKETMAVSGEEDIVLGIIQGHQQLHQTLAQMVALKQQGEDITEILDAFGKQRIALFTAMDCFYLA